MRNDGLNIATRLVATNVGDAVHALREGGCDLMLAFYDPDAALQMDAEIFPSLHMGNTGAHNVELVCPRQRSGDDHTIAGICLSVHSGQSTSAIISPLC